MTLAEIAETTKVAASLFASIERGDSSRWPGGVYDRAFIRGYANAVHLDPNETAAEFAEIFETPSVEPPARTPAKSSNESLARPALRLNLEVDPAEGRLRLLRATALAIADMLAIAALTAAFMFATGGTLWKAIAVTAVAYHVIVRIAGSLPRIDRFAGRTREASVEPHVQAIAGEEEAPVSGTASTVA